MSFKDKFSRIFSKSPTVWESSDLAPEPVNSELREHERYESALFSEIDLMSLNAGGTQDNSVVSISYGGFAFSAPEPDSPSEIKEGLHGVLTVLGDTCPVDFNALYKTAKRVGCQFVHGDAHVLVFLRPYVEYLRRGSTLFAVDPAHLKNQQSESGLTKHYFQGEGPVDLILQVDAQDHLHSCHLTFREQDQYLSVQFEKGRLQTAIAIDQVGVGARMAPTRELDLQILRKAIFLIAGAPMSLNLATTTAEFYHAMLGCFSQKNKAEKRPA